MGIEQIRDGRRVTMEARLRPEAAGKAVGGFTDDEAGARAREAAREAFAAGESVELHEGVWVRVSPAPVAAAEAYEDMKEGGIAHMAATLSPGEAHDFTMRVEVGGETITRQFTARPLPPPEGAQISYGATGGGLALFLDFRLGEPPTVSLDFKLSFRPRGDAAASAAAAKFMLDFQRAERVTCVAPDFLPDDGVIVNAANKPAPTDEELSHLGLAATLYDALATIEDKIGPLDIPEKITHEDLDNAVTVAGIIRTGGGTFNVEELALEVPFGDVDRVMHGIERGHPGQHPIKFTVFGRELELGMAEFRTPPVQLVSTEKGSADGMVVLRLRTDNASVPFRIAQPPSEPPALSSQLWTPARGGSGMVQLP